jgi:hypothetical protein
MRIPPIDWIMEGLCRRSLALGVVVGLSASTALAFAVARHRGDVTANAGSRNTPPAPSAVTRPPEAGVSEEDSIQRNANEWQERLLAHNADIHTDASAAKERAFAALFAARSKQTHFSVRLIDCRSQTCLAVLQFPSYGAARHDHVRILPFYDDNHPCPDGTRVHMEDPTDPRAPYAVSYLYACGDASESPHS